MQPEHLFLLEFLVDSVNIQWQGGTNLAGQTVVTFQFLNFQKQEICESICPGECPGTIQKFESGKSCLFSIPELQSCLDELIITVGVFKKQPAGILPEVLEVGKAKIDLTNEFAAVLKDIGEKPTETPASRAIKDDFILYIPGSRDPIGSIRLFIRFSCFGKSIVTGFSLGHSGQSYLFKGQEETVYRAQKMDASVYAKGVCGEGSAAADPGRTPCGQMAHMARCGKMALLATCGATDAGQSGACPHGGERMPVYPPYGYGEPKAPPMDHVCPGLGLTSNPGMPSPVFLRTIFQPFTDSECADWSFLSEDQPFHVMPLHEYFFYEAGMEGETTCVDECEGRPYKCEEESRCNNEEN